MKHTTVGDVEVFALVDTVAAYPAAAVYPEAGDALANFKRYLDGEGRVELNFACFLLVDGDRRILVDTGYAAGSGGRLPEEIAATGVKASEIDTVIFTHLHGDHTAWNLEDGKPRFANARYLVPRLDWDHYGSQTPPPDSFMRDVVPLEGLGCLELIEGERPLTGAITALPTPGHTPGHTSLAIVSGGQHGFVLGDVVISPIDAERPGFKNGFDWDHERARATREATLARLLEEDALVAASHLPVPGLGRFVRADGGQQWQGVG